jgi:hypothetical protein
MTPEELSKFIDLIGQLQQAYKEKTNPAEKLEVLNNFSYYLQSKLGNKLAVFYQEVYPGYPANLMFTLLLCDEQLPQLLEIFCKDMLGDPEETR